MNTQYYMILQGGPKKYYPLLQPKILGTLDSIVADTVVPNENISRVVGYRLNLKRNIEMCEF